MTHKRTHIAVAVACLAGLAGCGSRMSHIEPQSSVAMFDSFEYSGDDAFYNANPLPDESSYYNPVLAGWYSDPSICTNGQGDYFLVLSVIHISEPTRH